MASAFRSVLFGVSAALLTSLPLFALADGSDTEAQRLGSKRTAERYNVTFPGSSTKAGAASIYVNAPLETVRKVVTDYGRYSEFVGEFRKSRVIGKKDGATDVYLEVSILRGAAKICALTRFGAPTKEGTGERIDGNLVEGPGIANNVEGLRGTWHYRPVDDTHTLLKLELLVLPKLPVPSALITPELASAADQTVTAVRNRAEAKAIQDPVIGTARKEE